MHVVPRRIVVAFLGLWLCTVLGFGAVAANVKSTTHRTDRNQVTAEVALERTRANALTLQHQEKTLLVAQLRGCHRLNIQRAIANRNNYSDFKLYSLTSKLLRAAAQQPPDPRLNREQQARARRTVASYTSQIEQDARGKEWTPLTKCGPATYHPETYETPTPVSFAKRPPPSALHVGPGE